MARPFFLSALALSLIACGGSSALEASPASDQVEATSPATEATPRREGLIRRNRRKLTLLGPALEVGKTAPTAELRDTKMKSVTPDFADGKDRITLVVPSLDTPTCSLQTRQFNERAAALGEGVEILVVSRDLPFAQERFCAAHGIDQVKPLSDFARGDFGLGWGLYIEENDLLARAVIVTDGEGIVRYLQIVENIPDEPDYDAALKALAGVVAARQ